jgi:AraC-like DNA-binding protein
MNLTDGLLLIICGLGVAQSLFFAICLFSFKEGSKTSNLLLCFLLLSISIRLAKSIAYYFFDLGTLFMNIGYAAHLAVGPLLYLYLLSYRRKGGVSRYQILHLTPILGPVVLSNYLTESHWLGMGYSLLLYHALIYTALSWVAFLRMRRNSNAFQQMEIVWLLSLLVTLTLFNIAYFSNFILRLTPYIGGPLISSLMIYYISFLGLRYYKVIFGVRLQSQPFGGITGVEWDHCITRLNEILKGSKPFLDPGLTLPALAKQVGVPPYKLSQLINSEFNQSFSDLINMHRIEEAKRKLGDPSQKNKKIAAIAYEAGFNTLSAFNYAFKKIMHITPSEYRDLSS